MKYACQFALLNIVVLGAANRSVAATINSEQMNLITLTMVTASDIGVVIAKNVLCPDTLVLNPIVSFSSTGWAYSVTSTYQGTPLSLHYDGTFNPSSAHGSWTATGQYGATPLASAGNVQFSGNDGDLNWVFLDEKDTVGVKFATDFSLSKISFGTSWTHDFGTSGNGSSYAKVDIELLGDNYGLSVQYHYEQVLDNVTAKLNAAVNAFGKHDGLAVDFSITKEPEPATLLTTVGGLALLLYLKRRR